MSDEALCQTTRFPHAHTMWVGVAIWGPEKWFFTFFGGPEVLASVLSHGCDDVSRSALKTIKNLD
ncbi:hypothetical protein GCM10011391_17900 [Pullulanibacillus camelliae]|uniref:Uncharacterized protein n=1 Tax=Pullulanibacillus camelliae TaxID=1707096 RepID=A0A8J2YDB8_9BACL|nr:hypothetical protein GCM10011391_17900 [Pullulanibacillus camelliae]